MLLNIQIKLGNEAMLTGGDVESCIRRSKLSDKYAYQELSDGDSGVLRDTNGNVVGSWIVVETL